MPERASDKRHLEWGVDSSAEVGSVTEMDELLDRLDSEAIDQPLIVELLASDGAALSMGLGRSVTVVNWVSGALDPPYFQSFGDASDGELVFRYRGEWSEYPPESAVPADVGRRAFREFFTTGARPTVVRWQEV